MDTDTDLNKDVGFFVVESCIRGIEFDVVGGGNKLNSNVRCAHALGQMDEEVVGLCLMKLPVGEP